jgi:hypothetical protein
VLFFSVSSPTDLKFSSVPVIPAGVNRCGLGPPTTSGTCANFIIADLTGNGKLGLTFDEFMFEGAVIFGNGFTSLGNGDGTFQAPVPSGASFNFSIAADFNGDGKLDQVGVGQGSLQFDSPYGVFIALGKGDGTFSSRATIASGTLSDLFAYAVVAGDFNRDGKLDVAVGDDLGIEIYLGNGDGTFQPGLAPVGGGPVWAATAGDLT